MVDMGGTGGGVVTPSIQQYCLKWNNHQNNLLRVFMRLLGQEQFTDVTIAAEGRRIKCHKMVLSACSSYFEHLFMAYSENNQIVILKDTPYQDIAAIVEFMYRGEINVSQDRLSSLLKTAENLKVKGLAEVSSDEKKPAAASAPAAGGGGGGSQPPSLPRPTPPLPPPRLAGPPPMQMMGRPLAPLADPYMNGELKRKRGRPRTLDGPEDDPTFRPRIAVVHGYSASPVPTPLSGYASKSLGLSHTLSPLQTALSRPTKRGADPSSASPPQSPPHSTPSSPPPIKQELGLLGDTSAPGGSSEMMCSLTPEKVASWGIIKMNDYLVTGTRQQYWEELFVKHIMEAVKSKELDMKGAAELLGVSYGTLYGRYRENFGYLKHAWNISGRPQKKANLFSDPGTKAVLESMRAGHMNVKQAAEALGMDPGMLAFQLAGKSSGDLLNGSEDDDDEDDDDEDDDDDDDDGEGDYEDSVMEVQPDIIVAGEEDNHQNQRHQEAFDSIVEEEGVDPISNT